MRETSSGTHCLGVKKRRGTLKIFVFVFWFLITPLYVLVLQFFRRHIRFRSHLGFCIISELLNHLLHSFGY